MTSIPTIDNLTDEQRSKLESFQSVTQLNDIPKAISYLQDCSWNLERAVHRLYDGNSPSRERPNQLGNVDNEEIALRDFINGHSIIHQNDDDEGTVSELRRSPLTLIRSPILRFLTWPFSLVWNVTSGFFFILGSVFSFITRISGGLSASHSRAPSRVERRRNDPVSNAHRFVRDFEDEYGNKHVDFLENGYTAALSLAKTELKFLVVILQSSEHDNTDQFNRYTLINDSLIEFLREKEIVVWGGDIRESEAYQVSNTLQATTYPFVAVIALTTPMNSISSSTKMAVVDRIEGPTPPGTLIQRLTHTIARHAPQLARVRNEREQMEAERRIRSEQDVAYQSAALADVERIRRAREEIERKKREEEVQKRIEEEQANRVAKKEAWKAYIKGKIVKKEPEPGPGVGRFAIRLANGERVIRRFNGNDTLEDVFMFVETYGFEVSEVSPSLNTSMPPKDYVHKYDFALVCTLPRQIFKAGPELLRDQKGLWPSANVIVEELDDI